VASLYVELHCHSNFSFLDGASHPEDLARQAARLGYSACALTDHSGLYGAVRFSQAACEAGIKPIFGAEVITTDEHHLVLLVENDAGYAHLCQLLSTAQLAGQKGRARVPLERLPTHAGGLIALSGCEQGEIPTLLKAGETAAAKRAAARYAEWFGGDHFYLELQHHNLPVHELLCQRIHGLGRSLGIPCVATNNVHYATPEDRPLQDVLTCIQHHTTLDEAAGVLYPNAERYLKPPAAMVRRFARFGDAVARTCDIARRCSFSLDRLPAVLPRFPVPERLTPHGYLRQLTCAGARQRYGEVEPAHQKQIEHELRIIGKLDLAGYFLIVWDIARFCRQQKILCQGRGSAANSVVCYCLGITAVDPVKLDLLFERFISEQRAEPPDIDIDIANNRREEVIQYVYHKYGREHAAMVCEVICYRGRSAVRDVGKTLGFATRQIDGLARQVGYYSRGEGLVSHARDAGLNTEDVRVQHWLQLVQQIQGYPRHLGIHVGGMIVTARPLAELVPTENATMPNRSVIQWDKDDAQDVGFIKIDLLGLGMLTLIDEALKLVEHNHGVMIDPAKLSYADPKVYDLLCRAETVGVFQVESRAQMNTLPRMKPRTFYDLVVEVALIRPGPIQGGMVHPYLLRRDGKEPVTYSHPVLEPILKRTLGVPLFQEQGMKVAVAAAGFTPSQADELRRAMGHKRSREKMEALGIALVEGMMRNGIDTKAAHQIFDQLSAFADFGFAESHAASFALLVYVSAYLKHYYPTEFYCALLNAQPMGFYSPSTVMYEARRRGMKIMPVDCIRSAWDCTTEGCAIRLGFRYIKKLGEKAKGRLEAARAAGPFTCLEDFVFRTRLDKDALQQAAMVGIFRGFGYTRRQALWHLLRVLRREPGELPLFCADTGAAHMPPMLAAEAVLADFQGMNASVGAHPMELVRMPLSRRGILTAADLEGVAHGDRVEVAGIVVIRQRPGTAKGFLFITLEDETGFINVVVKPQQVETFRQQVVHTSALHVTGTVERAHDVINVIGTHFEPLRVGNQPVRLHSRDFR
jgi:error-prone DNA polymerase